MITKQTQTKVVVGVDTHRDNHIAVAFDALGRTLGQASFPAKQRGYKDLLSWSQQMGSDITFGIEGTNCYGAGLSRFLTSKQCVVNEVIRPNRQHRRRHGKSDVTDAAAAGRAVLSGEADGLPKGANGNVEMIRVLRIAKQTAIKARTQAINTLKSLLVTAPDDIRSELKSYSTKKLIERVCGFRTGKLRNTRDATKFALKNLGIRYEQLGQEIAELTKQLETLTEKTAPQLTNAFGIGTDVAATILIAVGDNPQRLKSEAAFAKLCGVAPVDCSSGANQRRRLSRSGDRQANAALYRIALVRMRWDKQTQDYINRRMAEGKTKREAIRCLKRYIAREVYGLVRQITA